MVVATETAVFWNMTPCILVQVQHLFPCIKVTQSNRLNSFILLIPDEGNKVTFRNTIYAQYTSDNGQYQT